MQQQIVGRFPRHIFDRYSIYDVEIVKHKRYILTLA